jgi:hypothetical protein
MGSGMLEQRSFFIKVLKTGAVEVLAIKLFFPPEFIKGVIS